MSGIYRRVNGTWVLLGHGSAPDTTAPTAPGNLRLATRSTTSITVAWDASTDVGSGINRYEARIGGGAWASTGTNLTRTFNGLAADTVYVIDVRAVDNAGNTSANAALTASTSSASAPRVVWGAATSPLPSSGTRQSARAAFDDHQARVGTIGCYRTYLSNTATFPGNWSSTSAQSGGSHLWGNWQARWSWLSFKPDTAAILNGSQDVNIRGFVNSIPVTGMKRMLTIWHEPESSPPANWKEACYRFQSVAKSVGHPDVMVGPCFTSALTLNRPGRTSDAVPLMNSSPVDLASVSDFVAFDPYHEKSRTGASDMWSAQYQGDQMLAKWYDPLLGFRDQYFPGKPLAFGEVGACNNADTPIGQHRADYLTDLEQWCIANKVLAVCYYDSSAGQPVWIRIHSLDHPVLTNVTYPDDPVGRAALGGVYSRNRPYAS